MAAQYWIGVVSAAVDDRAKTFANCVQVLVDELGAGDFVDVRVGVVDDFVLGDPSVAIIFWDEALSADDVAQAVARCDADGLVVIPVVPTTREMPDLPPGLAELNALGWDEGVAPIARACLRELGLHESARGVFISHCREDSLLAAETLYDAFSKSGWRPFVDRFDIDAGANLQARIDEALEECAFVLLLETAHAADSRWVQHEVLYALDRHLGIAVVNIEDAPEFASARDLPRERLDGPFESTGSYLKLDDDAVATIIERVETIHAIALCRRRRQLLVSAAATARSRGLVTAPAPGWRMRVYSDERKELVGVVPHLPQPHDLFELDEARGEADVVVLVHAAHVVPAARSRLLSWTIGERPIELLPNNAIGARWANE